MKTKKYTWGNRTWEFYNPKVNRKRQAFLGGLVLADIILPMTFGIGIIATKLIIKFKPLFLYQ